MIPQMKRSFFHRSSGCPFSCRYCFAAFRGYIPPKTFMVGTAVKGFSVLYPSCDGEFLFDFEASRAMLEYLKRSTQPAIVSFSTKSKISRKALDSILRLDEFARQSGGFVRVAFSFSTLSLVRELEPGAAGIAERTDSLASLVRAGIQCSATLKPLLPFIEAEEYVSLMKKILPFSRLFLLGGLYFEPYSAFFDEFLSKYSFSLRNVNWLANSPRWAYIDAPFSEKRIREFAVQNAAKCFSEDTELLHYMNQHRGLSNREAVNE